MLSCVTLWLLVLFFKWCPSPLFVHATSCLPQDVWLSRFELLTLSVLTLCLLLNLPQEDPSLGAGVKEWLTVATGMLILMLLMVGLVVILLFYVLHPRGWLSARRHRGAALQPASSTEKGAVCGVWAFGLSSVCPVAVLACFVTQTIVHCCSECPA